MKCIKQIKKWLWKYLGAIQWLFNSLRHLQTGAPRLRSFLFASVSTWGGNRGLPELISLKNTQSFVEHHTAGPAVWARGLGLDISKPHLALVRKWEKFRKKWEALAHPSVKNKIKLSAMTERVLHAGFWLTQKQYTVEAVKHFDLVWVRWGVIFSFFLRNNNQI